VLASVKKRLTDMNTLRQVFLKAETCARAEGIAEPGAEHLVMAALTLADGTARRAFERIGADPAAFAAAVTQQYADALRRVGVAVGSHLASPDGLPAQADRPGVFRTKPSARTLIKTLAGTRPSGSSRPLLGADILLAAASNEIGTVARALAVMNIDPGGLMNACRQEILAFDSGR
jgi:hypothetical protein